MTDPLPGTSTTRFQWLRILASVSAVLFGVGLIVLVAAIGHCSSFGGACPADSQPLWEDDVFGSAAFGGFVAVAVPMWLARPSLQRMRLAVPVGLGAALVVGLIARSAAAG